ncbi:MAG: hypothetical protein QM765_38105 [Myxococcales bacterium]
MNQNDHSNPKSPQQKAADHLKRILKKAAIGGAAVGATGIGLFLGCDPAPEPIHCEANPSTSTLLTHISTGISWEEVDAGAPTKLHAYLSFYSSGTNTMTWPADPEVTGATVSNIVRNGNKLEFDFVPSSGTKAVEMVIQVGCNSRAEVIKISVDVSSPVSGGYATVTSLEN